jgi:hypothetical protein
MRQLGWGIFQNVVAGVSSRNTGVEWPSRVQLSMRAFAHFRLTVSPGATPGDPPPYPPGTARRSAGLQARRIRGRCLKTVEKLARTHEAQWLSYLKTTRLRLDLLINFRVLVLKDGIERVVR